MSHTGKVNTIGTDRTAGMRQGWPEVSLLSEPSHTRVPQLMGHDRAFSHGKMQTIYRNGSGGMILN